MSRCSEGPGGSRRKVVVLAAAAASIAAASPLLLPRRMSSGWSDGVVGFLIGIAIVMLAFAVRGLRKI